MTISNEINFAYKSAVQFVLHDGYVFCRKCYRVKANKMLKIRVDLIPPFQMFPVKEEFVEVDLHPCNCQQVDAKPWSTV